ncbi:Lactose permease [Candida viswanathii]|uniref:Lactose permease n=1 Tax=Candida viswanathii TaxID=5486 RepID=A0A367XS79_9ASCO|nr:Lactose permease [Candida viswanathii]
MSSKDNIIITEESSDSEQVFRGKEEIDQYLYMDKPWYRYRHLCLLHFWILIITLTSTNNGYDGSMLNGLQVLQNWKDAMGNPQGAVLGALSNGNTFGGVISFAFASILADKFGRKSTIMLGVMFTILGAILQGVSTNYTFFIWARIILGFGFGISTVSSPALIAELSYPSYRETCTALYNTFWNFGAIIAAWVTFGTQPITNSYSWRIPSYLQGAMPVVQMIFIWWIPESPRYLVAKGKTDAARKILLRYHTGNDGTQQGQMLVDFEIQEITAALEMEKLQSNSRYIDFIKIPTYRKRLFLLIFTAIIMQLSGNGLVSYYLNKVLDTIGITEPKRQLEINGCLMIYNMVLAWAAAFAAPYFKRRTLFLASITIMLASYIIWTALSARFAMTGFKDHSLANSVLAFIFIFYLGYNTANSGNSVLYVSEILPFTIRAKGINVFFLSQNMVLLFNGFVNPIAMDAIEWKYYIVYCCVLAVELAIVYFFYVETSGYTLEEVARAFGDDDLVHVTNLEKPNVEHVEKLA